MATILKFEDLEIWKEAVKMGVMVFKVTEAGKMSKDFSARAQLRRAAISVSNNIAEGFEYNNNRLFVRFLMYAKGSAGEVRSMLYILKDAGMIDESVFKPLWERAIKLSRDIEGFRKYLRTSDRTKPQSSNL